jgi:hypothetical protein
MVLSSINDNCVSTNFIFNLESVSLRRFRMSCPEANEFGPPRAPARTTDFPTTHWTLVMRVREGGAIRQGALEELCALYWYPIYAFLRRRG